MTARDRIAGALYGQAIGDAIARQTEFLPFNVVLRKYGVSGVIPFPEHVAITDDTSMMLATAKALPSARYQTAQGMVSALLNAFISWNDDQINHEYTVLSNAAALDRLKTLRSHKRSWTEGTSLNSASVALTRATPVTFGAADIAGVAQLQTAMTHADPVAIAASELYTLALQLASEGTEPFNVFRHLFVTVRDKLECGNLYLRNWLGKLESVWPDTGHVAMLSAWLRMRSILRSVESVMAMRTPPRDTSIIFGNSFSAETAFANGLYFWLKYEANPEQAVCAASLTSDSTATAAVTGALIGAQRGEDVWPVDWRHKVNICNQIEDAVNGLYAMRVNQLD